MTPQSTFMIVAPIQPSREAGLRQLLASMNRAPGVVDLQNTLIPFAQLEQVHFARFVILDDRTTGDIAAYGLPVVNYPTYLAFMGELDGTTEAFFAELVKTAADGLSAIFSHCVGFSPSGELLAWIGAHNLQPSANYINWVGRTVGQVREEEVLHQAAQRFIQQNAATFAAMQPRLVHDRIQAFIEEERRSGRIPLTPPKATPVAWKIGNLLNLFGIPIVFLLLSPLLLLCLPFFLIVLRHREHTDPVVAPRVDPAHANLLASIEDQDVTNQFSAMGSLKPGLFRRITISLVFVAIDYSARHIFNRGRLARVTTIHFARWVFLDKRKRVLFISDYDGSLESYMDDFINKVAFGLNVAFGNGLGYPTTNWLLFGGAKDEQTFKGFLRRHQLATQVWYNACPGLTARDRQRNTLIREGLEKSFMNESEARQWLQLF